MSQSVEKHKSKIPKSRSSDFLWHSKGNAKIDQETNSGDLAPCKQKNEKQRRGRLSRQRAEA